MKKIREIGCVLVHHGDKHDWYTNHQTGETQATPRHRKINEHLAKAIIKALSK